MQRVLFDLGFEVPGDLGGGFSPGTILSERYRVLGLTEIEAAA